MPHEFASSSLKHRSRLIFVLALTAAYTAVEATVGIITNSLVLIADAGHMLTDVAGLTLALVAIWFAQRPANERKTYGYYRSEILAALFNALLLLGVSAYILYEASQRFRHPQDVPSVPLLVVATIGLGVNVISFSSLIGGARDSLNVRGAMLEVAGDALGSLGAIAAGLILLTTGWRYADPLFAAAVAVFILPRTWNLLKAALDILLEGTPPHIEMGEVERVMLAAEGVRAVHDLHVWTVTSGFIALSGHVEVADDADRDRLLVTLRQSLGERFAIEHVTIQVENERLSRELQQPCFPEQQVAFEPIERAVFQHARGDGGGE
jgi:cobalt-zinc-cadmium efflux system protein